MPRPIISAMGAFAASRVNYLGSSHDRQETTQGARSEAELTEGLAHPWSDLTFSKASSPDVQAAA